MITWNSTYVGPPTPGRAPQPGEPGKYYPRGRNFARGWRPTTSRARPTCACAGPGGEEAVRPALPGTCCIGIASDVRSIALEVGVQVVGFESWDPQAHDYTALASRSGEQVPTPCSSAVRRHASGTCGQGLPLGSRPARADPHSRRIHSDLAVRPARRRRPPRGSPSASRRRRRASQGCGQAVRYVIRSSDRSARRGLHGRDGPATEILSTRSPGRTEPKLGHAELSATPMSQRDPGKLLVRPQRRHDRGRRDHLPDRERRADDPQGDHAARVADAVG